MSRLGTESDSTGTLASYRYLGLGQIVEESDGGDSPASAADTLSYLDSSGNVTGLDRFGRVVDQIWKDAAGTEIDWYRYQYDRAGNRNARQNKLVTDGSLDEAYTYDNLDRLTDWYVGDSETPAESWNLDALGNNLGAGSYNAANEETPTGQSGDPYDAAGNMITLQSGNSAIYDAWNRLVEVDDASQNILQRNVYDGTNRRIQVLTDFDVNGDPGTVSDDYFQGQQVIETRENSAVEVSIPLVAAIHRRPDPPRHVSDGRRVNRISVFPSGFSTWPTPITT